MSFDCIVTLQYLLSFIYFIFMYFDIFVVKTLDMLFAFSPNLLWCIYAAIKYSKIKSQFWDLGFGINFGSRCFHRSRECSLAHPKPTQLQRASRLGLVVPMKKLLHSCKYSTGANRTILSEVQLQLPVKEGTPNYNIQFVSTFEDLNTPTKSTPWN